MSPWVLHNTSVEEEKKNEKNKGPYLTGEVWVVFSYSQIKREHSIIVAIDSNFFNKLCFIIPIHFRSPMLPNLNVGSVPDIGILNMLVLFISHLARYLIPFTQQKKSSHPVFGFFTTGCE
jgi:hypothetical protein